MTKLPRLFRKAETGEVWESLGEVWKSPKRVWEKCGERLEKSDVRLGKVGKSVVRDGKRLVEAGQSPLKERRNSGNRAMSVRKKSDKRAERER